MPEGVPIVAARSRVAEVLAAHHDAAADKDTARLSGRERRRDVS